MQKAKILYLITQSEWGGAQKYVFDLAVGLKDEFEVAVAFGGEGELQNRLAEKGVRTFVLKNLIREICPWKDFLGFWEIYKLIKKEKPDILHTNSTKAEILGNLAGWLAGTKKIIFTAHGFVFNEDLGLCKKKFYVFWEKLAGFFADKIICVSEFDKIAALKNGIARENKLRVIHNGIEIQDYAGKENAERGKIIIGTVANLYKNKALEFFVAAAAILNKKHQNLEFEAAGEGGERKFLEGEIKKYGLKNFRLLGFKNNPENYLQNFDIFVLPSVKEGFPYAVLEALSFGIPVVAAEVGGVPEAVEDEINGFLVPAKNSEMLAEKISQLIQDPQKRMAMGNAGREKVQKEFSLQKMLEKTRKLY